MPCECFRNFVGYYDNLISTILACSTGGDEMDEGVAWVGLGILCVLFGRVEVAVEIAMASAESCLGCVTFFVGEGRERLSRGDRGFGGVGFVSRCPL